MTATYTIPAKPSNSGSIHDIAGEQDRLIQFGSGCQYAVVCASYYGGKGYTTHRTELSAAKASKALGDYSHEILDTAGNRYAAAYGTELFAR